MILAAILADVQGIITSVSPLGITASQLTYQLGTPQLLPSTNPPVADFSGTPVSGSSPLTVAFTDLSTYAPTAWHWEKNNGTGWVDFYGTPFAQNPSEDFDDGTWSVKLSITNAGGSGAATKANYISVVTAPSFDVRITMDGDTRVTMDGDRRVTNG